MLDIYLANHSTIWQLQTVDMELKEEADQVKQMRVSAVEGNQEAWHEQKSWGPDYG